MDVTARGGVPAATVGHVCHNKAGNTVDSIRQAGQCEAQRRRSSDGGMGIAAWLHGFVRPTCSCESVKGAATATCIPSCALQDVPGPGIREAQQNCCSKGALRGLLRKVDFIQGFALVCRVLCVMCAGHSCEHELETARINGVLGNMDANTGEDGKA
jgi:hypothetical protein